VTIPGLDGTECASLDARRPARDRRPWRRPRYCRQTDIDAVAAWIVWLAMTAGTLSLRAASDPDVALNETAMRGVWHRPLADERRERRDHFERRHRYFLAVTGLPTFNAELAERAEPKTSLRILRFLR
jgi:hypothetical protein